MRVYKLKNIGFSGGLRGLGSLGQIQGDSVFMENGVYKSKFLVTVELN